MSIKLKIHVWKSLFWGFSILFAGVLHGQSSFNRAYPEAVRSYQVLQHNDHYYTVAQAYAPQLNRYFVRLLKMDAQGNVIKTSDFLDSSFSIYPSNHISLERTLDSNFITVYSVRKPAPRGNGLLIFDTALTILSAKVIPQADTLYRLFYQVKPAVDGGFIVAGYRYQQGNIYEAMLLKTDSASNPLWERIYQGANGEGLQPFFVYNAPAGGFLLTGLEKDPDDATTNDPFLIRTDSQGNVLWKKVIGSPGFDGAPATGYLKKGKSMIVFYSQETDTIPDPKTGYRSFEPVLVKIDDRNGTVTDVDTGSMVFPQLYVMNLVIKDDIVLGVGSYINFDTTKPGGGLLGFSLAADTALKEKWFKTYSVRGQNAQPDDYNALFDIRTTSDNGFVCAGYHQKDDTIGTGRAGYHMWLLKLDSAGCEVSNCANEIGVEEGSEAYRQEVYIYPNPADDDFTVSINGLESGHVWLIDTHGVLLKKSELEQGRCFFKTKGLANGFYFINISDGKSIRIAKKVAIYR